MRNRRMALAWTGAWLLLSAVGSAHAAADAPVRDRSASPRSLPADNVPSFGILDDDGNLVPRAAVPNGASRHAANSEPESNAPGPSLALAVEAARAAIDTCAAAGYRIGAAVIDSVGEARALLTADGSDGSHVFVAMRKALTALRFEMPSSHASEVIPKDPELLARVTPNMFVAGGAVPIMHNGETIGAIGVSGAGGRSSTATGGIGLQDEACAVAGLRKIEKQIR
ncbi:MAG TPA: heme-binding protein [Steroidobacteraceae bacterium]|jgi:uncharacterized protein GlcG (DUF336 family)|nr:heme-binding protein [Steroidobacteraceae bacterium]